jgi:ribonucleoside-diphosphate reductase alpha chain
VAQVIGEVDRQFGAGNEPSLTSEMFFDSMRLLEFLPNSPTLMNAGRDLNQLSACFILPVEDALDSIFETVKNTALIHKSGGGTGFSFSKIRPKGDKVRSTQGVSSGPVSFMRVFDAATEAVKQGGTRRGANMGVLRVEHPDIFEFIDAKAGGVDLKNFNISVAVTDAFMASAEAQANYSLVHPVSGQPSGHLNAAEVFRRICRRAWENGDPGIIFWDRVNQANPTPELGELECTNPCGEQPLLPYESCNLGSINLARMTLISRGRTVVNYPLLARTVRLAVHFLDNVIEANQYPLPEIADVTRRNRKIGLGVMGWADLLTELGIPYGSERALTVAEKIMGFIHHTSHRASCELALERGPYPNFSRSREGRNKNPLLQRNASVTTVAPTGTISIIAGCTSGIEPIFALSYARKNILDGRDLVELHPGFLRVLADRKLDTARILDEMHCAGSIEHVDSVPDDIRQCFRTALQIAPEWHVRMQAVFQKHSDSAVSKTVNLPFEATPEDVENVYRLAFRLGCKGITVFRDRCRDAQVLNVQCAACA